MHNPPAAGVERARALSLLTASLAPSRQGDAPLPQERAQDTRKGKGKGVNGAGVVKKVVEKQKRQKFVPQ